MGRYGLPRKGILWLCAVFGLGLVWVLVSWFFRESENRENMMASIKLPKVLKQSYVHLSQNRESIMSKIGLMKAEGRHKLIVISDFDLTLTKYWVNGQSGMTSYRVLESSPQMPESFRQETSELRDQFAVIEHNHDSPLEQRALAMEDWTSSANKLLVKYKLKKEAISEIVAKTNVKLRFGYHWLAELLSSKGIPLLIFSAGLWDTLTEILEQQGPVTDNVHIISNRLLFNEHGIASDYEKPVIHSYSKGLIPEQFADVKSSIKGRHNILLLGDALSDTKMIAGLDRVDHVIKIGFLNRNEDKLISVYKDQFDIVLTEDPNLDVPLSLLQTILD